MTLVVLDAATAAAVAATTDREANIAALVAPWAGGNVTARILAGSTLLATLTQGPWVAGPTSATLGTRQARTFVATGTPTRVVFRAGSTDIFELSAGVGSGDVSFAAGITNASLERIDGLVVNARSSLPDLLPSWVPAPGEITTLTVANGRLANNFRDAATPWFGAFYHIKTCNDYSTSVVNPYFGTHGMVVFFGGGHSGTNDNTLTGLEMGEVCTFRNLVPGTPYEGTGTDSTTRDENGNGNQNDQLDFATAVNLTDNKPASPHSYGALDVIGPEDGGAAHGTLSLVIIPAANRTNDGGSASSWKVDFADTVSTSYAWVRRGTDFIQLMNELGAPSGGASWAAPAWTQFVPAHNRTYMENNGAHSPRWFDHATNLYNVSSAATQRPRSPDNPNSSIMFAVPERGLLVFAERSAGVVRLLYRNVAAGAEASGWNATPATLSASIPVPSAWSACCWCSDNERIIVGMQTAADPAYQASFTTSSVIEIEIPATLTDTWMVTEAAFTGTLSWVNEANVWKKWSYNPRVRGISFLQFASVSSPDVVQHYRPRGT